MKVKTVPIMMFGKEYPVYTGSCCSSNSDKRTLYVEVTDQCNACCDFCSAASRGHTFLNPKVFEEVLTELVKQGAVDRVSITGGEPLSVPHSYTFSYLNALESSGVDYYAITTNGRYLSENMLYLDNTEKLKYINVSRHHWDDDGNRAVFHDAFIPGIQEVARLLDMLHKPYRRFRLNCTLGHSVDPEWIRRYIDMASENAFSSVLFRRNYFDRDNTGFRDIFGTMVAGRKESTKCRCMHGYVESADLNVEYREVDAVLEQKYESEHQYIRNFVLHADGSLTGGWSDNSLLIKRY